MMAESAGRDNSPPSERKRTPFFGAFFKQLLDPSVSVNDRATEFFAAALGKAISKMYESMGESLFGVRAPRTRNSTLRGPFASPLGKFAELSSAA